MLTASLSPLAGGLLSLILLSGSVLSRPSSFAVEVPGSGAKFLDAAITSGNIGLITSNRNMYFTNITLGGLNMTVVLDTGSEDLWISPNGRQIDTTNTTDVESGETFGKGVITGNVDFAELKIGDFTINSQAFLSLTAAQEIGGTRDGVLGVNLNKGSQIRTDLALAWGQDAADALGNTPLPSLFYQQPELQKNFDVQLARTSQLEDVAGGIFIIGGHDENFQNITDAPQLPNVSDQHWGVAVDDMNVNGQPFAFNDSTLQDVPQGKLQPGAPQGKVAAAFDSGFLFSSLPSAAVDAIYLSIPGAVFSSNLSIWVVPCNASTKLSFVFGGQEFFVHPLDLTSVLVAPIPTSDGGMENVTMCINAYQYFELNPDPDQFRGFTFILGDSFLRNAYISFNFGDDSDQSTNSTAFVQMVATTPDFDAAVDEFNKQRSETLAQLPPAIDPFSLVNSDGLIVLASPTDGSHSTDSQAEVAPTQAQDAQESQLQTTESQPHTTQTQAQATQESAPAEAQSTSMQSQAAESPSMQAAELRAQANQSQSADRGRHSNEPDNGSLGSVVAGKGTAVGAAAVAAFAGIALL